LFDRIRTRYKVLGVEEYPFEIRLSDVYDVVCCRRGGTGYFMGFNEYNNIDHFWIGLSYKPIPETFFKEYRRTYGTKRGRPSYSRPPAALDMNSWPFIFEFYVLPSDADAALAAIDVLCPKLGMHR
jgi:hypothetical protein